MSTRSTIAVENTDGTFLAVYCHFDGYPTGVGAQLKSRFDTEAKVRELIAGGDLRAIPDQMEPEYYSHNTSAVHTCDALRTAQNENASDYLYIFRLETQAWEAYDYDGQPVEL